MSIDEPTGTRLDDPLCAGVLDTLARARTLFGGGHAPADPPPFAAPGDLEDDLGRGTFSPSRVGRG